MRHITTHWPKFLSYVIRAELRPQNNIPRLLVYRMPNGSIRLKEYPVQ